MEILEGKYGEKFQDYCKSLDKVAVDVESQEQEAINDVGLRNYDITQLQKTMVALGADPEEVYKKQSLAELNANIYSRETLEALTVFNMEILDVVSTLDLGKNISGRCQETKQILSCLPQDDYRSRYIVSTNMIEFFVSEYKKSKTMSDEKIDSNDHVKTIGTK